MVFLPFIYDRSFLSVARRAILNIKNRTFSTIPKNFQSALLDTAPIAANCYEFFASDKLILNKNLFLKKCLLL